jgi:L-aminopeptidase/D-esterase-like protein
VGSLAVAGSAPGTRQSDGLQPGHLVDRVNAVLLTGGSAFGLDAAGGVAAWLEEQGRGAPVGPFRVPIVPTAVIFDLAISQGKGRPGPEMARQACQAAGPGPMARGNVGAGAGATVGKLFGLPQAMKGGLGGAAMRVGDLRVGVMVVVNAFGDILDPAGRIVAGARQSADSHEFINTAGWFIAGNQRPNMSTVSNTTLGVVATNARLDKNQAHKVASLALLGMGRAIDPVHTTFDGDLIFAISGGKVQADINGLGVIAAHLIRVAILDAVTAAESWGPAPSAREVGVL